MIFDINKSLNSSSFKCLLIGWVATFIFYTVIFKCILNCFCCNKLLLLVINITKLKYLYTLGLDKQNIGS